MLITEQYVCCFVPLHQHINRVINDKIKCFHSVHALIVMPTEAYDLLQKLQKLCNRDNSCCGVGAVEMGWMGMGKALGALPVELKVSCELHWLWRPWRGWASATEISRKCRFGHKAPQLFQKLVQE